jgi:hypothetical protein
MKNVVHRNTVKHSLLASKIDLLRKNIRLTISFGIVKPTNVSLTIPNSGQFSFNY